MKKQILTLALMALTGLAACSLRADTTNTTAAVTNAVAAVTNAVAAATTAPLTNGPSVEQRLESMEAYFQNADPTATYKDTNGNYTVNFGLGGNIINTNLMNSTGSYVSYPGAGHNAWLLTSTALVLFMTLPGLALFYGGMVRKKNILSVMAPVIPPLP